MHGLKRITEHGKQFARIVKLIAVLAGILREKCLQSRASVLCLNNIPNDHSRSCLIMLFWPCPLIINWEAVDQTLELWARRESILEVWPLIYSDDKMGKIYLRWVPHVFRLQIQMIRWPHFIWGGSHMYKLQIQNHMIPLNVKMQHH